MPKKGWKHPPSSIAKMRAAWTPGRHAATSVRMMGNTNPLGAKRSTKTRAKIGASLKGRPLSPAHREKLRDHMIGNTNMKGYKVSPEARAKHGTTMKKKFQDPAYCERYRVAMNMKPNKPETFLLGLLEKMYPGEWKYTGDFSFIINGKNPDFVNVNGQKKIIEVFGDYWHRGEDPADRVAAFSPFGYQTLVIWERDLKDVAVVTSRIHDFNREEMT